MAMERWVNVATKAYQQAVKYEHVSKEQREQLFHFVHDWFQQVCDENQAIENMDKTPSDVLCDEMEKLNGLYERLMKNNQKFRIN